MIFQFTSSTLTCMGWFSIHCHTCVCIVLPSRLEYSFATWINLALISIGVITRIWLLLLWGTPGGSSPILWMGQSRADGNLWLHSNKMYSVCSRKSYSSLLKTQIAVKISQLAKSMQNKHFQIPYIHTWSWLW